MIKAYIKYWKKWRNFQDYSSRSDYWWVFLVNVIIFAVLNGINFFSMIPQAVKILDQSSKLSQSQISQKIIDLSLHPTGLALLMLIITSIFGFVTLLPNVALTARRLRDGGFPWWISILFGLAAVEGLLVSFIQNDIFGNFGIIFTLINLITYIMCLFSAKYRDDEEDDSRTYE